MGIQEQNISATATVIHPSELGDTITSDKTLLWYQWICHCFISPPICAFGVVTNIINIICFIKLGFHESVNVTLCGLAVSDLGCIVTMIWYNICMTPVFRDLDLPFDVDDLLYLLGGFTHANFARITASLTAFLTLERCLCIAMPLKVKRIFTIRRVSIFVVAIFVILLLSASPVYCVTRLGHVFSASRNKTILATLLFEGRRDVFSVSLALNNVVIPFGAFIMVITCTTMLVVNLHRKTEWRKSAAAANAEQVLRRDQKISNMVLIISTVFIVCFIPTCMTCLAMAITPQIEMYGRYRNTSLVLCGVDFALESTNSSVNIFIYYNMSSKFKARLRELLRMSPK